MVRPIRIAAGTCRAAAVGIVGAGAVTMLSQTLGRRAYRGAAGMSVAAIQTLTPHLAGAAAAISLVAAVRRRPLLAATAATVAAGGSAFTAPVVGQRSAPAVEDPAGRDPTAHDPTAHDPTAHDPTAHDPTRSGSTRAGSAANGSTRLGSDGSGSAGHGRIGIGSGMLRIATANLLYTNVRTAAIADTLLARDLDVIAFTEYTAEHQEVLLGHDLAARYTHRIDREGPRADGVAVWSRLPLDERATLPTVNNSIDVLVGAPGGLFRLVVVHTPTPFDDLGGWADDLELVGGVVAAGGEPIVLIGDLNATTWHPAVRAMFANGCSDALAAVGQPFASSWPAGAIVPPFAQLDHALVGPDVVVADAGNFPIPGSDHRGLEVTVRSMR